MAYHSARLGIPATIVMPRGSPNTKIKNTRVHERAFVVRLHDHQLDLEAARQRLQALVDLRQRHRAVDLRLAAAEQVQVGAMQDQDAHRCFPRALHLRTTWRP